MITIEKPLSLPWGYPLERLGAIDKLLFFDIETTGFSGSASNLYLIGCAFYKPGGWNMIQWFADCPEAEKEILHAFFQFIKPFSTLAHFNGDNFDIPYLLKRCLHYGLDYNFNHLKSIYIYRMIRPYKKLLGLDSLKQKSIEGFLRVNREDRYSGGQLIGIYHDYLLSKSEHLYQLLILHNEDDLKGMPSILPILYYYDFLMADFTLIKQEIIEKTDLFGTPEQELSLTYQCPVSLPVPVQAEQSPFTLELRGNKLLLTASLFQGELKHFYPDYQNYYYLVYEDQAIHKSVGQYVEKDARKKATAKNCYTRFTGIFLPQPEPLWEPALKQNYKDKLAFIKYTPELFTSGEASKSYLSSVLCRFFLPASASVI